MQLRDEAVRDRVRAAQEFLDPSMFGNLRAVDNANQLQVILLPEATDQISFSCCRSFKDDL